MKPSLLALILIFFSLISGAIGTFWVLYFAPDFIDNPLSLRRGLGWGFVWKMNTNSWISVPQTNPLPPQDLLSLQESITSTVASTSKSIVSIVISKDLIVYRSDPWWFFQQPAGTVTRQVGGGSGFFIKKDGTILTNKHVVSDPNAQYTVILNDGSEYKADVLALDPVNDLAVIKITPKAEETFIALEFLKNTQEIDIWEFTIAVGNALAEFQNSVSLGIVSGKNRSIEANGDSLSGLIQTDAAINPGNSGGPLLDLSGRVMGINTAIVSGSSGIGFAIALSQEKIDSMMKSITESGRIKRPFIGINYIPNSQWVADELNLKSSQGVYIIDEKESVVSGSSAEKAGLEPGDIILEANGNILGPKTSLESLIQNAIPWDTFALTVLKKSGEEKILSIELGEY